MSYPQWHNSLGSKFEIQLAVIVKYNLALVGTD